LIYIYFLKKGACIMANTNYPLYETTVFEDFRVMTENAAKKFPDRVAISYKKSPKDTDTVKVTYTEARDYIRHMGTELIHMGLSDKHVADRRKLLQMDLFLLLPYVHRIGRSADRQGPSR
jgi:hypothetical protein